MQAKQTKYGYILKLERGEKVVETITQFCKDHTITSGIFHGIGAVKNTTIGYYSLKKREYFFKSISEDMEVASMTGNIALVDEQPFLHTHAVLSKMDETLACIGAHIKEAEVAVTLEVFLINYEVSIKRELDKNIGLKLLKFE
ncbi:MAG: DNA-binding protein [Parcubacteria group bacterium]|nr:DNA-binding protein [Parcubacteria group bacterium]